MALYIPHSIFHLARLLYVRPETFGPYYVALLSLNLFALDGAWFLEVRFGRFIAPEYNTLDKSPGVIWAYIKRRNVSYVSSVQEIVGNLFRRAREKKKSRDPNVPLQNWREPMYWTMRYKNWQREVLHNAELLFHVHSATFRVAHRRANWLLKLWPGVMVPAGTRCGDDIHLSV